VDRDFYGLHSELCKTLANDKRQMILGAMREGEVSVTRLVELTGIPQPNLSQHLSRMRAHGVVVPRRDGLNILYSIANPKLMQAFDLITEVLQEFAAGQSATAEATDSSASSVKRAR